MRQLAAWTWLTVVRYDLGMADDDQIIPFSLAGAEKKAGELTFPPTDHTAKLLKDYSDQANHWNWQINLCRFIQVVLGTVALVCTAVLTLFAGNDNHPTLRMVLAASAAVSLALLNGLGVGAKADRWRQAWRYLRVAIDMRLTEAISDKQLVSAYGAAENLIGGVAVSVHSETTNPRSPAGTIRPAGNVALIAAVDKSDAKKGAGSKSGPGGDGSVSG